MDASEDFAAAQGRDDTLDLPPVAEAQDIAEVAAAFRASRCLKRRGITVALDEISCVSQRETSVDEGRVHPISYSELPFQECRQMWSTLR